MMNPGLVEVGLQDHIEMKEIISKYVQPARFCCTSTYRPNSSWRGIASSCLRPVWLYQINIRAHCV
jgi:hypothetical protein